MPLQPGQILNNRYRIDGMRGQGGFGAVYLAWDQNLEEHVAIKESLDVSPHSEKQFRSEAKLLFRLRHANLPRVFDCFALPNQGLYLAMDYIEGESLAQRLERGPLPVEQVLEWIKQICDALQYLHGQTPPVIHRDIKPANIIIAGDGRPYLVDFGISKLFDPDRKTTVGARAYTPGYSPPEQYGAATTDERSDIYALGATLYHLLTGQAPPPAMDITAGIARPPLPPQAINPTVPVSVGEATTRAMRPNRAERWESAGAFKQALSAPAASTVVVQPPGSAPLRTGAVAPKVEKTAAVSPPRPVETVKIGGRPLVGLGIAGGVLAACIVLALVGYWIWSILDGQETPQPTAVVEIETEPPQPINTKRPTQPPVTEPPTEDPSLLPANLAAGDAWTRPADGMVMIYIPEGEFRMGSAENDSQASDDEKPQHMVYLDGYWIDRTEVTNAMFGQFLQETSYDYAGSIPSGKDDHPVANVSWNDAVAYCEWVGGNLPTEAQWEKAARGTDGRIYPWGDQQATCDYAVMDDSGNGCGKDGTWPVGSKLAGASPYGVLDMVGNVWEWLLDWYQDSSYQDTAERNPTGPSSGTSRVLRGGSWRNESGNVRTAIRSRNIPTVRYDNVGFRCSR